MSKKGGYTPNEQRSNALNPNNAAHHQGHGNRGAQLNPNREPAAAPSPVPTSPKK
jgi:hypothetical protein